VARPVTGLFQSPRSRGDGPYGDELALGLTTPDGLAPDGLAPGDSLAGASVGGGTTLGLGVADGPQAAAARTSPIVTRMRVSTLVPPSGHIRGSLESWPR